MSDHGYESAAREIGMTVWWLRKNIRDLPHQKYGTSVRFTDAQIAEIKKRFEYVPPTPTVPADVRPLTRRRAS